MIRKNMLRTKLSLVLLLVFLSGCESFRPSWIDENYWKVEDYTPRENIPDGLDITEEDFDGPLGGHFDPDTGEWIPDDKTIEATYKIPDISAGFLVDFAPLADSGDDLSITPSLQVEVVEFDLPIDSGLLAYIRTWKFDIGVGYQRTYGYLGVKLTSIFEISVGPWVGWDWDESRIAFGVGVGIIKF